MTGRLASPRRVCELGQVASAASRRPVLGERSDSEERIVSVRWYLAEIRVRLRPGRGPSRPRALPGPAGRAEVPSAGAGAAPPGPAAQPVPRGRAQRGQSSRGGGGVESGATVRRGGTLEGESRAESRSAVMLFWAKSMRFFSWLMCLRPPGQTSSSRIFSTDLSGRRPAGRSAAVSAPGLWAGAGRAGQRNRRRTPQSSF